MKLNRETREYNCLTRHFIEAIHLVAVKAEIDRRKAIQLKLKYTPDHLYKNYLLRTLGILRGTQYIDEKAADIQKSGVPFICSDIPHLAI